MADKKTLQWFLGLGFVLLFGTAVVISFLGPRQASKTQENGQQIIEQFGETEVFPGEMLLLFYEDKNANGQFDYEEQVVKNVAVAVRRPGEEWPFVTVAADVSGWVRVGNLPFNEYEIAYLSPELEQPVTVRQWRFKQSRYSFLPSGWRPVNLGEAGYKEKVGIVEYQPKNLLVIVTGGQVKFYDPDQAKVLIESQFEEALERSFKLLDQELVYLDQASLVGLDLVNRVVKERLDWLDDLGDDWRLSPQAQSLIYRQNDDIYWAGDYCSGPVTIEGERLKLAGPLVADFWDETSLAVGEYLVNCLGQSEFAVKKLDLPPVDQLFFLEKETLFYTNTSASFFYDLTNNQSTKYTALGKGEAAEVSADRRYISSLVAGARMIVDYPAVKASGVEKHYLIPLAGEVLVTGNEAWFNQSRPCDARGDCGEIVRVSLKGNGVWEIIERIDLKDVYAQKLLGIWRLKSAKIQL